MSSELRHECPGCGVEIGERHKGCDIANCVSTGQQLIQCPGEEHEFKGRWYGEHEGECGPTVWTGLWPGTAEAEERGWYSVFEPGRGWRRVSEGTPGATADLNRVAMELVWSKEKQKMVDRPPRT